MQADERESDRAASDSDAILPVEELTAADVGPVEGGNVKGGLLPPGSLKPVVIIPAGGDGSPSTSVAWTKGGGASVG